MSEAVELGTDLALEMLQRGLEGEALRWALLTLASSEAEREPLMAVVDLLAEIAEVLVDANEPPQLTLIGGSE